MEKWMSGLGGTFSMIALWTVGWGLGFGGLIEAFIDPNGEILDVWLTAMAIPGVIGGVIFSVLIWSAEHRRTFDIIPVQRMALWGAVAGIGIGAIAMAKGIEMTLTTGKIFAITTVLGLVAAVGSAIFFRLAAHWLTQTTPE